LVQATEPMILVHFEDRTRGGRLLPRFSSTRKSRADSRVIDNVLA
jgi:hypothetical protein